MKKYTLILFVLLLASCGTRKVELEKLEGITIENTYSTGSKIVLGTNITFKPFDNSRPFKVDGREYDNVVVSNEDTKTVENWITKTVYKTETVYITKVTEKSDSSILWICVAFFAFLFIFLWFYLQNLSK